MDHDHQAYHQPADVVQKIEAGGVGRGSSPIKHDWPVQIFIMICDSSRRLEAGGHSFISQFGLFFGHRDLAALPPGGAQLLGGVVASAKM